MYKYQIDPNIQLLSQKIEENTLRLRPDYLEIKKLAHECAQAGSAGFSYGNVCACCRGERNMHKGYRWKYV